MSMTMNLYKASNQWSTRPADERFSTVEEMTKACQAYREIAHENAVPYSRLRVLGADKTLFLTDGAQNMELTHWAFGQLCQRAEAPASYLRTLPTELVANNLNHGLAKIGLADNAFLMYHQNGNMLCRSITSERYARIWNSDICLRLQDLQGSGWMVPPARPAFQDQPGTRPATEADVMQANRFALSVSVGDLIAPAGLYASDHDMFAFLVDPTRKIEDGTEGGLRRGFFIWNSEVGSSSFGICAFLWRHVCGNHIVWDAKNVYELKVRHIGKANDRAFNELSVEVRKYAESSASDLERRIGYAKTFRLGQNAEEVTARIYSMRIPQLSKKLIEAAYTHTAETAVDGDPNTAWGLSNGMTRISQTLEYADDRVTLDRAAGKVMEMAF